MEACDITFCLWDRNIELRENSVLTMGTIIRILTPSPIITYLADKMPMIETQFPALVIHHPCQMNKVNIDNELKAKKIRLYFTMEFISTSTELLQKNLPALVIL